MAQIKKRKNKYGVSYLAYVRRKGFKPVSRTFDTKGEAIAWAAGIEQDMKDRRHQDPRLAMSITFKQAVERYLETVSSLKAVNTQMTEKKCAKRLLEHIGAETPLGMIDSNVAAKYRDARMQNVSAYPVRLELALLSHLFNKARKEWGYPVKNPVDNIERPAVPKGRTRFLTDDEAERLLKESKKAKSPKFYYYILTLLHTGMRPSETAGLRWGQVHLDKRMIHLPETKNSDERWVPMTLELVEKLAQVKEGRSAEQLVFLKEARLKSDTAKARPSICFREMFDAARTRANLQDVHMHDLRHTAASHLIMAGVDIRTLAEILGHKTLQMVQRYTHLLHDHKLAAIDKISGLGKEKNSN